MSKMMRSLGCVVICFGFVTNGISQTPTESPSSSIGGHLGFALPMAGTKHRYADVNQFGGSILFGGDLEIKTSDKVGLAISGGYAKLDLSKWEDFAIARGDQVSASASMSYVGLLLRPYLKASKPDIIKLEFGPALVFTNGNETFGKFSYDYDFFQSTSVGILVGVEYDRFLSDNLALAARITSMIVPSGIEYADGKSQTIIIMPFTVGMRFHF